MPQHLDTVETPEELEGEFLRLIKTIQDHLTNATSLVGRLSSLPSVAQIRGDLTVVMFRMYKVRETVLGWDRKGGNV
jgi:hypothetical protein